MPPFPPWADLPPELLCRISDALDLTCYGSARGACTAWRRVLAPPSPSLLLVPDDVSFYPSAASLLTRRSFQLKPIPPGARCVGSSNGWLALSFGGQSTFFSLFNPVTAAEVVLPPLTYTCSWVPLSKLVFAPNPAADDFAAAAICGGDRLAYVTAGARRWAVLRVPLAPGGGCLTDAVYHEKNGQGRVYCLTSYGDVHLLRLPERRRRPVMVDRPPLPRSLTPLQQKHGIICRRSVGPHLNAPATVEPLLPSLPFDDPAAGFVPPYNTVSAYTGADNLVFCEGNLYQVWRNDSPGGGGENEVFVLRYYPGRRRRPCWDAVTDLGGYSVFLGMNNAASMMNAQGGGGVPGLKGNCVYWIDARGKNHGHGMVYDMATGRSTPCLLPAAAAGVSPQRAICWYFLRDSNGGKRVYQTRARVG